MHQALQRRFARRTKTGKERFEHARRDVITQPYGNAESRQVQQRLLPTETPAQQSCQGYV